jgi:DNA helicase-2/ATP-dependent DNA helicase PcrA
MYAEQIGLNPDFAIHDREGSADLANLVRHELGFSKTDSRFPTKGTLPVDLFASRQLGDTT